MFCSNCGKENPDGAQFCTGCGCKIGGEYAQTVVNQVPKKSLWSYFTDTLKKFYKLLIDGRARRSEFWGFILFYSIFLVVAGIVDTILFGGEVVFGDYYIGIFMLPMLSVGFRRMHDVGKPAGYYFIPIYNLILCLKDSDKGENKYGPSPKEL